MSDQSRIREALQAAVPDAPIEPDRAREARVRAERARRQRWVGVVGVALVVALGGAGTWAAHRKDVAPTVTGTGEAACRAISRDTPSLGAPIDTRMVDGRTTATWLRDLHSRVDPDRYADARRVVVCVFSGRGGDYSVVAHVARRSPDVVSTGGFDPHVGPMSAMQELDDLWNGGAATTNAPFACPGQTAPAQNAVSNSLPSGATGALLCYDDGTLYSPRVILNSPGVEALLLAVDRAPVIYSAPNVTCGGIVGFREYSIVFRYPSGTRTVSMKMCRGLAIGPFTRNARDNLDITFERFLLDQVQAVGDSHACRPSPSSRPSGVGDVRHVVAARYCAPGAAGAGYVLGGAQLRTLRTWGQRLLGGASTEPEGRCAPPSAERPRLQLADAWGNTFTMTIVQCLAYGRHRYLGAVLSPGGPHRVTYPLSEDDHDFTRLLRQLTLRP
jgi:hypothetical protein